MDMHRVNLDRIPLFLPTMYGDIKLTAQGGQTEVEWENLSPTERVAMDALGKKFTVDTSRDAGRLLVAKPVDKVEKLLANAMKRGRKLLTAVVFKNGKIEELHRTEEGGVARAIVTDAKEAAADVAAAITKPAAETAKAAVTVAQPAFGCPVPEFERAQVRATRVLREFLTPRQLDDFERTQQFLVVGADSGHRYVLTSRQAPHEVLEKVEGRSVYDCTRGVSVCVHDWTVPASEEMLELALFLQMPGYEHHVNELPLD